MESYQFAWNFGAEMNGSHKTILFYSFITWGVLGWLRKQKIKQHSSLRHAVALTVPKGTSINIEAIAINYGNELQSLLMTSTGTKHLYVGWHFTKRWNQKKGHASNIPLHKFNWIISRFSLSKLSDGSRTAQFTGNIHWGPVTISNGNKNF